MWSQARTAEQIRAGLHQEFEAHTPDLVVDLRFKEGASLSVIDHSANNHRGLLRGNFIPERIQGISLLQTAQFTISVEDGKGGVERQSFTVSTAPKLTVPSVVDCSQIPISTAYIKTVKVYW